MANLNFQQPPRSIPSSASLSGRGGTAGGFGNSSLSGHVTPTSGMFPTAATGAGSFGSSQPPHSQQQQQQQQQQGQQPVGQGGQSQPPQLSPGTVGSRNGGSGGAASSGGSSSGGGSGVVGGSSTNPATSSASTNGSQQQSQQLSSTNSSASSGANARSNLFGGQRGFADRRAMPGLSGTTMVSAFYCYLLIVYQATCILMYPT